MRNLLKRILSMVLSRAGILRIWEKASARCPNLLRVLVYHRVSNSTDYPDLDPALISASPVQFERQMRYLVECFCPISIEMLITTWQSGRPLEPNIVLVTFDDGYRDFAEYAWPILQKYRVPAVIFVPTAFPSDPALAFWWDRLYVALVQTTKLQVSIPGLGQVYLDTPAQRQTALRQFEGYILRLSADQVDGFVEGVLNALNVHPTLTSPTLTWDQIRDLHAQGLAVANHTRHHWATGTLGLTELQAELASAQADLRRELGEALPVFCYPNGQVRRDADSLLRHLGIVMAFSTTNGINIWPLSDPLRLHRIGVDYQDSFNTFRLQLTNQYARYKQLRRRVWHTRRSTGVV